MTRNGEGERHGRGAGSADRRVRRTQHALLHALMELTVERSYDRVTVQDIIDRADVGRSTFYAHFRDKDDLLLSGFDDELREAFGGPAAGWTQFRAAAPSESPAPMAGESPSERLFRHAAKHRDLFRVLTRRRGAWPLVRRRMEETLTEVFQQRLGDIGVDGLPVEVVARYLASGLLGLLSWWLEDGMKIDPSLMERTFDTLATKGIGALG